MNTPLSLYKNNSSGHKGVCFNKERGLWAANLNHNGVRHYLGCHASIDDAIAIRQSTAKLLQGEFYTDGKSYNAVLKHRSEAK